MFTSDIQASEVLVTMQKTIMQKHEIRRICTDEINPNRVFRAIITFRSPIPIRRRYPSANQMSSPTKRIRASFSGVMIHKAIPAMIAGNVKIFGARLCFTSVTHTADSKINAMIIRMVSTCIISLGLTSYFYSNLCREGSGTVL